MQTIVHEMVHAWQHHFGEPGRRGYHNQQWANKMIEVGLMPSDTGAPGGAKTGEKMADYSIDGGRFEHACQELLGQPEHAIAWYDRYPPEPPSAGRAGGRGGIRVPTALPAALQDSIELPQAADNKSNRVKLRCSLCGNQAWCKPGMKLLCGEETCQANVMTEAAAKAEPQD
jgi:hypothetical protein